MKLVNVPARVDVVKAALVVQGKQQQRCMRTIMRLGILIVKVVLLVHVNVVMVVVEKTHVLVSLANNLHNLDVMEMVIANAEVLHLTIHALAANSVLSILKYEVVN